MAQSDIIEFFKRNSNRFASSEEISKETSITRTSIQKALQKMKKYKEIEYIPSFRYRLKERVLK